MPASDDELRRAAALTPRLEAWFESHGREFPWRAWHDPFRITIAELLLQRARASVVAGFIPGFLRRFPTWESFHQADESELSDVMKPIGLYRQRAGVLKRVAAEIAGSTGVDAGWSPNIGQYVERAVRVMAHGERLAMVDSNFVRAIKRLFGGSWMSDYRYDLRLQGIAQALVDGSADARVLNWAILDLGSLVCKPHTPACQDCPVSAGCVFLSLHPVQNFRRRP
ncbi:MAG TPA: A/G-specific adenine glycosylase [Dehalococcoidia bacterium]|nr:A/G-specific adenine glycosylase [Dehalococcoidia bacterium]